MANPVDADPKVGVLRADTVEGLCGTVMPWAAFKESDVEAQHDWKVELVRVVKALCASVSDPSVNTAVATLSPGDPN